jgi:integrase
MALRAVREEMVRAGICRRTVNDRVNRVRRCFRWAVSVELIPVEVVQALATVEALEPGRGGARESEGVGPVPLEHVEVVLPILPPPVAAMIELQLRTGCRAGEVVLMRGADIDMTEPVWTYRTGRHKNTWRGKDRVILIGPRAQEVLRVFLKEDPTSYLFSPRDGAEAMRVARAARRKTERTPSELARVQSSCPRRSSGEGYTPNSYRQAVVRGCRQVGVPVWSSLQLRHTAARAVRKEFGLEAAQLILGHRRADVTQVYGRKGRGQGAADRRENWLSPKPTKTSPTVQDLGVLDRG